jgi:hypothetical protein
VSESFIDALNRIAQNDYMIDQNYLPDGDALLGAAFHIEVLEAEVEKLRAELARWQRSFAGHVYVPNEKYAALVKHAKLAGWSPDKAALPKEGGDE